MAGMSKRPFWMHQVVEYILGGAMIAAGLQSPTPLVPSVVGGVIMLNAAITSGPLSAFRVLDRRVHRVIDIVVIAFEMIAAVPASSTSVAIAPPWSEPPMFCT